LQLVLNAGSLGNFGFTFPVSKSPDYGLLALRHREARFLQLRLQRRLRHLLDFEL
jgi:hypothetical protein